MNVALIYPSMMRTQNEMLPKRFMKFYFAEAILPQPLGICYISAVLKKAGHKTLIIDMNIEPKLNNLIQKIKEFKPKIIGFSLLTHGFNDALSYIKIVKKRFPDTIIVVGGYHLSLYPEETMMNKEIDIGVIGDGEYAMLELVEAIESNKDIQEIKGICYRQNGKYVKTKPRELIKNLDELPYPNFEDLDMNRYKSFFSSQFRVIASMVASRGCPFRCKFCSEKYECYRQRSAKNVVEEMIYLKKKFGITEISFKDSTFTANPKFTEEFCDELIKRKVNMKFNIRTRVDCLNEKILSKLKQAGCTYINLGLESGNDDILKRLGKKENLATQIKVVKLIQKYGIDILANFMIGNPGDTKKTIFQTLKYAIMLNLDFVQFNRYNPFPGTEIYERIVKDGHEDVWRNFILGKRSTYDVIVPDCKIPIKDLNRYTKLIPFLFYFRPKSIINKIKQVKTWEVLKKYIKAAWALL